MWYMLYARGGREFEVAEAMQDIGIDPICETRCVFKRVGKDRRATPHDEPYLPNYIFAQVPEDTYLAVMQIKNISTTTTPMSKRDLQTVLRYQEACQAEYEEAQRIIRNKGAVCEYNPGQAMRFLDGRFSDKMLTFRSIVERAHDMHPKVVMDMEMMGRVVRVEADPLDVKAG